MSAQPWLPDHFRAGFQPPPELEWTSPQQSQGNNNMQSSNLQVGGPQGSSPGSLHNSPAQASSPPPSVMHTAPPKPPLIPKYIDAIRMPDSTLPMPAMKPNPEHPDFPELARIARSTSSPQDSMFSPPPSQEQTPKRRSPMRKASKRKLNKGEVQSHKRTSSLDPPASSPNREVHDEFSAESGNEKAKEVSGGSRQSATPSKHQNDSTHGTPASTLWHYSTSPAGPPVSRTTPVPNDSSPYGLNTIFSPPTATQQQTPTKQPGEQGARVPPDAEPRDPQTPAQEILTEEPPVEELQGYVTPDPCSNAHVDPEDVDDLNFGDSE